MDMNYRGEMWEGGGWAGWSGVGGKWDNCNSIINKYIKKKKKVKINEKISNIESKCFMMLLFCQYFGVFLKLMVFFLGRIKRQAFSTWNGYKL